MNTIAKQFSVVAFLGLTALTVSLGYGALIGNILSSNEFVSSLRFAGLGYLLGGLVLWTAARRGEAGKSGLNPLFVSLVVAGCLVLLAGVIIAYYPIAPGMWLGGVVINAIALLAVVLLTIVSPAFAEPVTKVWPEGGEPVSMGAATDDHAEEAHVETTTAEADSEPAEAQAEAEEAQSEPLTRIEGIGPKAQSIFYEHGVTTFKQVAALSPEVITKTLKDGGFKAPFNPESWPEQATLAAEGKWDELKELQDNLTGGRRK